MSQPPSGSATTSASDDLRRLAAGLAAMYGAHTRPAAMLLTGSAATGISDYHSDLDLIAYYDVLPAHDQLTAAHAAIGAAEIRPATGDGGGSWLDFYRWHGVEVQVAHVTVTGWERELATVIDDCVPGTLSEKAIIGLLDGRALIGAELIATWQAHVADYPPALAAATVAHYLRFFPIWATTDYWRTRDATIFYYQTLTETVLNLLGVLAGVNRVYFSTFQCKRLDDFAARLRHAPSRLADRIERLFRLPPAVAGLALRRLVEETLALLEANLPEIDTGPARLGLAAHRPPWRPEPGVAAAVR